MVFEPGEQAVEQAWWAIEPGVVRAEAKRELVEKLGHVIARKTKSMGPLILVLPEGYDVEP